jgi:hypothetical protein
MTISKENLQTILNSLIAQPKSGSAELVASSDIPTNAERTQILHDLSRDIGIRPVTVTNENRSDVLQRILAESKQRRNSRG